MQWVRNGSCLGYRGWMQWVGNGSCLGHRGCAAYTILIYWLSFILESFAAYIIFKSRMQRYAAYAILISRLRLYFATLCCLHDLDVSTQTAISNALLLTQSWYIVWNCILQCYAAYTILISRLRLHLTMLCCLHNLDISYETVFSNAMLLTRSWYLGSDCI